MDLRIFRAAGFLSGFVRAHCRFLLAILPMQISVTSNAIRVCVMSYLTSFQGAALLLRQRPEKERERLTAKR
jgi:hypothetical protein